MLILAALPLAAERVHVFKDLLKPGAMVWDTDRQHLYIVEFPQIHIYSTKDYSRIKTFGKQGEGPGEFLRFARIYFHEDFIIIHSNSKFSYFSKDWQFVKEHRVPPQFHRGVKPFGDKLVATYIGQAKNNPKVTDQLVVFHDWEGNKIKEIFRKEYYILSGKKINGLYLPEVNRRTGIRFSLWDNKIFIEPDDGEDGIIQVYDAGGKLEYTIKHEFEKLKVTDEHIDAVEEWHRLRKRRLLKIVDQRGLLYYASHFPAVHKMGITDGKIYIVPYKRKQGKPQLFIFDLKGKLLKHLAAPITGETMFGYYPWGILDGKIYQMLENEDEEWELHFYRIDKLKEY
jgi:hypothetical protein